MCWQYYTVTKSPLNEHGDVDMHIDLTTELLCSLIVDSTRAKEFSLVPNP